MTQHLKIRFNRRIVERSWRDLRGLALVEGIQKELKTLGRGKTVKWRYTIFEK